jgi:hypothetical protein
MWVNKQHGILPNQYHHFYDQGDTLIYPEHIEDLITIDKMYQNRLKREQQKTEAKHAAKKLQQHQQQGQQQQQQGSPNFYGQKFRYSDK